MKREESGEGGDFCPAGGELNAYSRVPGSLATLQMQQRRLTPFAIRFCFGGCVFPTTGQNGRRTPYYLVCLVYPVYPVYLLVIASGSGSNDREDEFNRVEWPTPCPLCFGTCTGAKATTPCGAAHTSTLFLSGRLYMQSQHGRSSTLIPRRAPETRPAR